MSRRAKFIVLQFRFAKSQFAPKGLKKINKLAREEQTGTLCMETKEKASLVELLSTLEKAGYGLVGAVCFNRPTERKVYTVTQYTFALEQSREELIIALSELKKMVEQTIWTVHAFENPCFSHGEIVAGEWTFSIMANRRTPLFEEDGSPVMVWKKNEEGDIIGDEKIPLTPEVNISI
ncbi:MAG: hypothetical protein WC459_00805 [Patescibacteria group bacterium]